MTRVCSWCGAVTYVGSKADAAITHTICTDCIAKVEKQIVEWERQRNTAKPRK